MFRFRKESFFTAIGLILALGLALLWWGTNAVAQESPSPVKIGVLAKRGQDRCMEKWAPTAAYLTSEIPGYSFTIVPLGFDAVKTAVENEEVDFILASPAFYVEMEVLHGASRIATLKNLRTGKPYTVFGGTIFHRADSKGIERLKDLKGKTFMAVNEMSFGGWLMAWRELK